MHYNVLDMMHNCIFVSINYIYILSVILFVIACNDMYMYV